MKFCPYCGKKLEEEETPVVPVVAPQERKKVSKKAVALVALLLVVVIAVGTVISWEVKIDKARSFYIQGEYWEAYQQVRKIPSLGREEVIRFKTAADAASEYGRYLTTKRIRLSSTSARHPDAYRDAFWELMFGLMLDLRWVQDEDLNAIEIDEYEKFIDLYYEELEDMFSMSQKEADQLAEAMEEADEIQDMKDLTNQWLEDNFF